MLQGIFIEELHCTAFYTVYKKKTCKHETNKTGIFPAFLFSLTVWDKSEKKGKQKSWCVLFVVYYNAYAYYM